MKIWKKTNRGLLAFGVLVVGLGAYITYDTISFKSNTNEVVDSAESYLKKMVTANITTDEDYTVSWDNFLNNEMVSNDYFEHNQLSYYYTSTTLKDYYYTAEEYNGKVSEGSVKVSSSKVKKAGPNLAMVTISFNMYYTSTGVPQLLTPCGSSANTYYYDRDFSKYENEEINSTLEYEDFQIYLEKVDGEWTVVACNGYSWGTYMTDKNGNDISGEDVYYEY